MTGSASRWLVAVSTASVVALVACGSPRRGEPLRGPMNLSPKAARGQVVFAANCHRCHPGGEGGLGPSLNDKPAPAFAIKAQVRLGLGAMPSFTRCEISDQELDDLVCYMLARRHH